MHKVYPYIAVDIWSEATNNFKVNGNRLKHYIGDEPIEKGMTYIFSNPSTTTTRYIMMVKLKTLNNLGRQPKFSILSFIILEVLFCNFNFMFALILT